MGHCDTTQSVLCRIRDVFRSSIVYLCVLPVVIHGSGSSTVLWQGVLLSTRHAPDARFVPSLSSSIRRSVMQRKVIARYGRRWCWCCRSRHLNSSRIIQLFIRRRALYFLTFVVLTPFLFLVSQRTPPSRTAQKPHAVNIVTASVAGPC